MLQDVWAATRRIRSEAAPSPLPERKNAGKLRVRRESVPPHRRYHKRSQAGGRKRAYSEHSMAQVCDICGKGPQFGNNISHAHNVTKRRWNVNLHPVRAKVGGGNKRLRVCSSCLKAGKVVKA